jgi:OOP family OmpA-OmpF porin
MKHALLLGLLLCCIGRADAQILKKIVDRTKHKTEEKVAEKVSNAATKPIDEVGTKKDRKNKKEEKEGNTNDTAEQEINNKAEQADNNSIENTANNQKTAILSTYSKFDFIPGEKILVTEDFKQDAVGDFPAKWNTNSSGEVVTADGQEGHWLMLNKKGRFIPDFITSLPENFTLQFDLVCNEKFSFYSNALDIYMLTGDNNKRAFDYSFIGAEKRSGVKAGFHPNSAGGNGGNGFIETFEDGEPGMKNEVNTNQFSVGSGKNKVKVSIWRQKQRLRVYLNEEKIFDLPRAFAAGKNYTTVMYELWSGMNNDVDRYLISNIQLAVGAPDTRNKLITEGKFVTRGILFDVNSDKIKPESYGVLKDIAAVLTENGNVKVKIIGHTDADGKDADNLVLSQKRAVAVKTALASDFNIDASRMQTDGKGESQPVDKNDSPIGKANNRRVEFIKL